MLKTLLRWVYNGLFVLGAALYLPKFLFERVFKGKYKKNWLYRLGLKAPFICLGDKPVVWVHAVSLGEVKASYPFVIALRQAYPEMVFVFSSVTETGIEEIKATMPFISHVIVLPLDLPWLMRALVSKVRPRLVVFIEGDLWWNFLHFVKKVGAKTLVVNGKISHRSFKRYKVFLKYAQAIFAKLDLCLLQNSDYKECFERLGMPPSKLKVSGNLKFDSLTTCLQEEEKNALRKVIGLASSWKMIVLGSTHPKEERLLLEALRPLLEREPYLKILVVPRHPERFTLVEKEIKEMGFPLTTWSSTTAHQEKIILMDVVGKLSQCYAVADIAIVGGSFVNIGGHNLLEPLMYGVPVLFGPYIHKQKELADLARQAGVGFCLPLQDVLQQVESLLYAEPFSKEALSKRAQLLISKHKGAVAQSLEAVHVLL
ncbi:MAG: 3-deoxy-D-manno-octulosonic acid transferase [Chlamydiae bacterium]|nr:3-deoxy-D-manno-octulosonic acid transferase [Chlamydiota bacterium]